MATISDLPRDILNLLVSYLRDEERLCLRFIKLFATQVNVKKCQIDPSETIIFACCRGYINLIK